MIVLFVKGVHHNVKSIDENDKAIRDEKYGQALPKCHSRIPAARPAP